MKADALPSGTMVLVTSAVWGRFEAVILHPFLIGQTLCYALKNHPWVYASEVTRKP